MFERFTERARQVVVLAQDEARALKHNYIGTEHILLGLLREEEGLAGRVLATLGVSLVETRAYVTVAVGIGADESAAPFPFTPEGKAMLEGALKQALALGHGYVGTEHLLLALPAGGVVAEVLDRAVVTKDAIRAEIVRMLSKGRSPVPNDPVVDTEGTIWVVRMLKEMAIDRQDFRRAALLRDAERALTYHARELEGKVTT